MQKCRFTTPFQDAGMQISACWNDSALQWGWDTHSSALSLQTQQLDKRYDLMIIN
jgi:hypothetical protein